MEHMFLIIEWRVHMKKLLKVFLIFISLLLLICISGCNKFDYKDQAEKSIHKSFDLYPIKKY